MFEASLSRLSRSQECSDIQDVRDLLKLIKTFKTLVKMELLTMLVVSHSGDHVFAGYDELHFCIRLMISGRIKITISVSYQPELKISKDGDNY